MKKDDKSRNGARERRLKEGHSGLPRTGEDSLRLREMAEKRLKYSTVPAEKLTPTEMRKLVHELQVHQIELEMQNDELRTAHLELEVVRDRYADLFDLAPVGYAILDPKGVIVEANLTLARMTGENRLSLEKTRLGRIICEADKDTFHRKLTECISAQERRVFEVGLTRKEGGSFPASFICEPSTDINGKPRMRIAINELTELRKAEDEIRRLYEVLFEKDRRKDAFLSTFGHDTRTWIASIISLSQLLAAKTDGPLTEEQEKQVGMIRDASDQMLGFVNELLDLSRIESGVTKVEPTDFDIESMFSRAASGLQLKAQEKGLALTFERATGIEKVRADFDLTLQVLMNLVDNAIKFTDEGYVRVKAFSEGGGALKPDPAPGPGSAREAPGAGKAPGIIFSVEDSGRGIPEDKLEGVFEEFVQLEPKLDAPKSSGLGLAIARRLVELQGGKIWAESQPGRGSSFHFSLPFETPRTVQYTAPRRPAEDRQSARTVLIVDDEQSVQLGFSGFLRDRYDVIIAGDGLQGLDAVKSRRPDLIFLDLSMPVMNGFEFLERLRADAACRKIPVVIYSSQNLSDVERIRLETYGAIIVPKHNVTVEELCANVDRFMGPVS